MDISELQENLRNAIKGYNSKSYSRILTFSYPDLLEKIKKLTAPYNPKSISESIYMILNGFPKFCSKGFKPAFSSYEKGYTSFCGSKSQCECSREHQAETLKNWQQQVTPEQREAMQARAVATFKEKYGVENPMHNTEIREKLETTNLEKYGVRYALENKEIQEKTKNTLLEKYGVDSPFKSKDIVEKAHETTKNKYGSLMTHARQTLHKKYEGKNPFTISDVKEKIISTNLVRYGATRPLANKNILNAMFENNIRKYGRPNPSQLHYDQALWEILQDKNAFAECIKDKSSVQVANQLNTRSDLILSYARKYDVLHLMNFQPRSAMEDDLREWLTQQQIEFKGNDKKVLDGLELDILIPDHKIAIELNGLYHHSELAGGKDRNYHWHKTKGCDLHGIQLLHIWQDEYWACKHIIQSKILYLAKKIDRKIHARQCKIQRIDDSSVESQFLNDNHIQGFADYRQFSLAAYSDNQIVAIMSFAHRRGRLELIRYATDINAICVGLFSRMLSHSIKEFKFSGDIVSQSDNRISNGSLYFKTGWKYYGEQSPDYSYTGDYATRQSKENFRKNKLIKKFGLDEDYVNSYTEWQIMQSLGYDRIWDAGKKTWTLTI